MFPISAFTGVLRSSDVPATRPSRPSKVTSVALPEEYDLARLVEKIEKIHSSWNIDTPACEWDGIECYPFEKYVEQIRWGARCLKGELIWRYLPSRVATVHAWRTRLHGEVPFEALPSTTTHFWVSDNELSGHLNLTCLPCSMEYLNMEENNFSGTVDLSRLPSTLNELLLSRNGDLNGVLNARLYSDLYYDVRRTQITVLNGEPWGYTNLCLDEE